MGVLPGSEWEAILLGDLCFLWCEMLLGKRFNRFVNKLYDYLIRDEREFKNNGIILYNSRRLRDFQ